MKCLRCGQCCTSASVALFNVPIEHDVRELGKWLEHHHCQQEKVSTPMGDVLGIRIPLMCKHITYDHDGIATCEIYEDRPHICKEFECQRMMG